MADEIKRDNDAMEHLHSKVLSDEAKKTIEANKKPVDTLETQAEARAKEAAKTAKEAPEKKQITKPTTTK